MMHGRSQSTRSIATLGSLNVSAESSASAANPSYAITSSHYPYSFIYALRVATLHDYISKPLPTSAPTAPDTIGRTISSTSISPAGSSTLNVGFLSTLRGSIGSGSSSSSDKSGSAKSLKYSEKLLKGLEQRLRGIAKGEDSRFRDDGFRRTSAIFWSNFSDPDWIKGLKESKKLEELILHFVTCSVKTVKKSPDVPVDLQNAEVNEQIFKFIKLLQEVVVQNTPGASDVRERVDRYLKMMDTGSSSATTASDTAGTSGNTLHIKPNVPPKDDDGRPGTLVKSLLSVYDDGSDEMKNLVKGCKIACTIERAIIDIQGETGQIDQGTWDYPTSNDFDNSDAFDDWRSRRRAGLEDQLEALQAEQAKRAGPGGGAGANTGRRSRPTSISDAYSTSNLFKPPRPEEDYTELLKRLLDSDLDALANMADTEMVPLGILSDAHSTLLHHCGVHWGIADESRAVLFCSLAVEMFKAGDIPVECVQEAISNVMVEEGETPIQYWLTKDANSFYSALDSLIESLTLELSEALRQYYTLRGRDIEETTNLLSQIISYQQENRGSKAKAATQAVSKLKIIVLAAAKEHYIQSTREFPPQEVAGLVYIARWLEKEAKSLDKRYPSSLIDDLDVTSIALSSHIPEFLRQLQTNAEYKTVHAVGRPPPDLQDVFYLYQTTNRFQDMLKVFVPGSSDTFDPNRFFEPYIFDWFKKMRGDVTKWVENAIAVDTFHTETPNGSSSSVIDVFSSLHHATKVLHELKWQDEKRFGDFVAEMTMIISLVMNRYGNVLLQSFNQEMAALEQTAQPDSPVATSAQQNILKMASKLSIRSEKKVAPPFNFQPSICVKINDAEEAMQQLDRLYWDLDIDRFSQSHPITTAGPDKSVPRSVFTIKIVRADLGEDVRSEESPIRTQVVLSDEKGACVAQTRIIADSSFPRWEETFDLAIDSKVWLMATVFDHDSNQPVTIGRAYFKLDEQLFPEMASKDLWLPLDTYGRLLLRISREKEKEDPQFQFGKAFWVLRKVQGDMTTSVVDKMLPTIRACISRKALKSLFRRSSGGSDAMGKIKDAYQKALSSSSSVIPPLKQPTLPPLTDVQIEGAIGPLLDYFDANLQVLSEALSASNLKAVLSRLWKEILTVVEDIIVPPLSDRPSSLRPLRDGELDVVLKWLKFLRDYFHAGGDESGLPLEELQTQPYHDLMRLRIYYDWKTDDLMEECVRDFQNSLRMYGRTRGKDLRSHRNLGTIKKEREEKRRLQSTSGNGEMIMRVLRMRSGTQEFLADQLRTMYHHNT